MKTSSFVVFILFYTVLILFSYHVIWIWSTTILGDLKWVMGVLFRFFFFGQDLVSGNGRGRSPGATYLIDPDIYFEGECGVGALRMAWRQTVHIYAYPKNKNFILLHPAKNFSPPCLGKES